MEGYKIVDQAAPEKVKDPIPGPYVAILKQHDAEY